MSAADPLRNLVRALERSDRGTAASLLTDDAGVRIWRHDGQLAARERNRALAILFEEFDPWDWWQIEIISAGGDTHRAAVEFVIQAREDGIIVDYSRAAFAELHEGRIATLDIYAAAPIAATRRHWIAPASLPPPELDALFASLEFNYDPRGHFPVNSTSFRSLGHRSRTSGSAHPGANLVSNVRWSADEAGRRIEEMIEWHRTRGIGFQWRVGGWDTPADLGDRLEHHGFVFAGDQALMARVGLEDLDDIPVNPDIRVERFGPETPEPHIEASLQINAIAFQWPAEQIETERAGWFERMRGTGDLTGYLAWLGDTPVASAALLLRGPIAYLAGAATLPEYRGKRIYSSLLRTRLEQARAAGREIATIHAEPMSRRVVAKYGFEPVAWYRMYAWMPEMDPAVIATLVQTD